MQKDYLNFYNLDYKSTDNSIKEEENPFKNQCQNIKLISENKKNYLRNDQNDKEDDLEFFDMKINKEISSKENLNSNCITFKDKSIPPQNGIIVKSNSVGNEINDDILKIKGKKIKTRSEINLDGDQNKLNKRVYIKSKDIDVSQQKYSCKICGKIYISYPAFYTHRRNRHNIISITNRHDLFKSKFQQNQNPKYNYNSIGYGKIINFQFSDFLIETMKKILCVIYKNENSFFYNKKFNINSNIFIEYLEKYKIIFSKKIFIPPAQLNLSIDEILVVYFILFSKVINDNKLIEYAAIFIIWFRDYLNVHGWDFYSHFIKFDLFNKKKGNSFTQNNYIQNIPDLAEDFILTFLKIEDLDIIFENVQILEDICKNLCNWLFINELSNLKLIFSERN